jgi:hypothetical protein
MRTDGVFQTKHVILKDYPFGQTLNLVPFGDIHFDSPAHAEEEFDEFCRRGKELVKQGNVLFMGMGDYLDGYSTSERMIIYSHGMHESSLGREEKAARKRVEQLAEKIAFMKGRLIGFMGGNHFPVFKGGVTGDQYLAELFCTDYLGACCAVRLCFNRKSSTSALNCDIFAHHGKGGGTTAGGRMNAVEKLEKVCDADIFLMGDNHARGAIPTGERLRMHTSNGKLCVGSKPTWIGRTGSFLKAYIEGKANYVVDAALPPSNLGHIEFQITPCREKVGGVDTYKLKIGALQ